MSLSEIQQEFALQIAWLIFRINARGYSCTFGDAYRSPAAHGAMGVQGPYGKAKSAHKQRLAVDLNLFGPDGEYLGETEHHKEFGEYWEKVHPDNVWGGRFSDGNHYSRRYNGIA